MGRLAHVPSAKLLISAQADRDCIDMVCPGVHISLNEVIGELFEPTYSLVIRFIKALPPFTLKVGWLHRHVMVLKLLSCLLRRRVSVWLPRRCVWTGLTTWSSMMVVATATSIHHKPMNIVVSSLFVAVRQPSTSLARSSKSGG